MEDENLYIVREIIVDSDKQLNKDVLSKRIVEIEFSVRTLNSLKNENIIYLGDLVSFAEGQLKKFRNMGMVSIIEIKEKLAEKNLELGMNLPNWPPDNINESLNQRSFEKKKVKEKIILESVLELIKEFDETTLSLRSKNALRNLGCYYIGDILFLKKEDLYKVNNLGYKSILEIEEYINSLNFKFEEEIEPWSKDIILNLREKLHNKISTETKEELFKKDQFLEIELKRILNESIKISKKNEKIKSRIIDVLINRFGLDGSPAKTLETIGQKYNVTRERIRQNQENGLRKLKIISPITPILDKVFEELLKSLPVTETEFNKILKEKNLTKLEWDFKGLQDFYETFDTTLDFYITNLNNIKIITKSSNDNFFTLVLKNVNKRISNTGLFSLSDCMNFKDIYLNDIKKETVKKIIQTRPLFQWLDDKENYFTYYSNRNRLSNLIAKTAVSSKTANIDNLFKNIKKNYRIHKNISFNKDVFTSFCKACFDCEIDDKNYINFKSSKSKLSDFKGYDGNIIAPNEAKMMKIFNDYGPILYIEDLKDFSKLQSIGSDSLTMMLQFSPIFYRIDKGFYTLSGKKKLNKMEKVISIINVESSTFSKEECPPVKNKNTYIEVNKNGSLLKALPYQRPLRTLPDGNYGVVFKKQVFPIIKIFKEINNKREEIEIN